MTRTTILCAAAGALAVTGCQSSPAKTPPPAASRPRVVAVTHLHLQLRVPAELADLTYATGKSTEGKPAADFSTRALTAAGGSSCAAGAANSVSPYPIGQIVLSPETPEHVAEEAKNNPDDVLGDYVTKVGAQYLYYLAPPGESCAPEKPKVLAVQQRATATLRAALRTATATP